MIAQACLLVLNHLGEFVFGLACVGFILLMVFMALFGIRERQVTKVQEAERISGGEQQ